MIFPVFNDNIKIKNYDSWQIIWNSNEQYRHWCIQQKFLNENDPFIVVVLFNPGSLFSEGENITKDTTLGILRNSFDGSDFRMLILNLFSYATSKPGKIFENWAIRDALDAPSIYDYLPLEKIKHVIFAYGDYENDDNKEISSSIKLRVDFVRGIFKDKEKIDTPLNISGTPQHPYRWRICRSVQEINKKLKSLNNLSL